MNSGWTGVKHLTFTAQTTTTYISFRVYTSGNTQYFLADDVSCREAVPDRSVKGNGLAVYGTPTVAPVATGSDVMAISGFSTSNYLEQPYNSDLDFGTGDFCVMGWIKPNGATEGSVVYSHGGVQPNAKFDCYFNAGRLRVDLRASGQTGYHGITGNTVVDSSTAWRMFAHVKVAGSHYMYLDGKLDKSTTLNATSIGSYTYTGVPLIVGISHTYVSPISNSSLSLMRISATAPTAEQIKEIYEAEKPLFQENAKCTLNGSSDAVKALAYDDSTELLHAGTSGGRSTFQGLRRVDETSTSTTEISAQGGLIVEETA